MRVICVLDNIRLVQCNVLDAKRSSFFAEPVGCGAERFPNEDIVRRISVKCPEAIRECCKGA